MCITWYSTCMTKIISYVQEFRRRGASYYLKDDKFTVVSNGVRPEESFIIMRALSFGKIMGMLGRKDIEVEIVDAVDSIKERYALSQKNRRIKK